AFGIHALRARVTDDLGGVNETPPVTFRLSSVTPPTVEIIAPTNGAIVRAGRGMLLSTTTSSGSGPAYRVDYSVDGTPIGTTIYPFHLPWIAEAPGDHTITAVAFDTDGQASAPATVPVFVQA